MTTWFGRRSRETRRRGSPAGLSRSGADHAHSFVMISDPTAFPAERSKWALSAAFILLLGLVASVILGPQLALWPSTPAILCLALAALVSLPLATRLPRSVAVTGLALAGWLGYRCINSPVVEFAVADGVLLASCIAVFWIVRGILPRRGGVEVLFTGLGVLVIANWLPMIAQSEDSGHVLWLPRGTVTFPSGFFAYYGDCAAFLTAMALLAGGLMWDVRRAPWFRILMALVALAAAAGVVFTKARGGIVGLGAGAFVLMVLTPWLTLRRGTRWSGVLTLLLPVLVVVGVIWLGAGLGEAQRERSLDGSTRGIFDNSARLFWLKLATSCIALHPLQGGGSRSFSWENLRFWEGGWTKFAEAEPEFVHNEFIQMTSDYGLVGLVLLVVFLGAVVVAGILGRWNDPDAKPASAVFVAGLAALTGLLAHACVHFVFHVPPAAWMLGLTLAAVLETSRSRSTGFSRAGKFFSAFVPAACAVVLGFWGIRAYAVFREMAPVVYRFGHQVTDPGERLARVAAAAPMWPGHALFTLQGKMAFDAAAKSSGAEQPLLLENAESAFREAVARHPFDAEPSVNLASVLSAMERDADAEREFARAIDLQGGLEWGFRALYSASNHHFRKAERLRAAGRRDAALESLILAARYFDTLSSPSAWEYGSEGSAYRYNISRFLGPWLEGLGRHEEAAAEYDRVAKLPGYNAIHFFAARNLTAWGDDAWERRRPEVALAKFRLAREQMQLARGMVPSGFEVVDGVELTHRLDGKIEFLQGAGIRPADSEGQ